ncbi:MAG: DUF11 domain-containing protein [Halobacteriota archaeon]
MKRRILVLCLLLALGFMAMAAPADAAYITVGKDVEDPFNRFCVGKTIHYRMLVGNPDIPGNVNLTLNVSDRYPNGTTELLEANLSLAVGVYKTYNRSYVVEAGDVGKRITNLLLVNGTTEDGEHCHANMVKDSDILDPGISITKVAAPTSDAPCTNVTFTINVTNTGDCTLDPVKVVDTLPEGMSYVSSDPPADTYDGSIIWDDVGSLDVNESTTITLVAHIDSGPAGTLTNNVVATGIPKDSMCGHIYHNATVTYCYNVTNTGDVSLTNVTVNDNIYGAVTVGTTTLAPGESILGTVTHISLPAWMWKEGEEGER